MKTLSLAFAILVFGSYSGLGQQPSPTPTPNSDDDTVRITTSLIQLDVVITDKSGRPVTDLRPDEIKVYQDGKLQTVTNLSFINSQTAEKSVIYTSKQKADKNAIAPPPTNVRSKQGRIITFVLDDGNCLSTYGGINLMRDSMRKFVDNQMQPDDRVAIYRTTAGVSLLQVYTSNKEVLRKKIEKISLVSPFACDSAFEAASNNATDSMAGGARVFESDKDRAARDARNVIQNRNEVMGSVGVLNFVVDRLMNVPQRKIVFLISEGVISDDSFVRDALRDLTEKAARASIVINTMSTKGLTNPGMLDAQDSPAVRASAQSTQVADARVKEENQLSTGLAYIANATGGDFIRNKSFLGPEIGKILDTQTAYYLIGYQPETETFEGKKFHKIEVKVTRPDVQVSSREGFYGAVASDSRPVFKNADSPLYQAMDSPLQDTGMEMGLTVLHGNSPAGNFIRPLFHIRGEDITFADDKDGAKRVVLDVVAVTLDEKGKVADEFNRTYSTKIPKAALELAMKNGLDFSTDLVVKKPGIYSFRLAVRDSPSKRLASSGDYVEIRDISKKDFFVSGLITTGGDDTGTAILPKARAAEYAFELVPSLSVPSIRQYTKGETLYYAYTVYNAKIDSANGSPNLTREVKLFHNGQLISGGPETPVPPVVPSDPVRIDNFGSIRITAGVDFGEYALQIVVRDKIANKVSTQWIDFEVIP